MPRETLLTCRRKTDYAVHSVENALDLLDAICDEGGEARVSQLSQRLGLSKASVFRLLATFEGRGFVERSDDALKYRLGLAACEMGQKIIARMGVLRKARPAMERLARQCNESVYFVVRRNDEVLMLDMVDSSQQVKIVAMTGRRFPLAATALGRIFQGCSNGAARDGGADRDAKSLAPAAAEGAETIRRRGVCTDENGFGEGVTCLAAPLLNAKGEVAAVLALLGPSYRMTRERLDGELLQPLREAAAAISAGLGFLGNYLQRETLV